MGKLNVHCIPEMGSKTAQYVVWDEESRDAAIIDAVYDFDAPSCTFDTSNVDALQQFCEDKGLRVRLLCDTHVHADHVTGSQVLKSRYVRNK